MPISNPIGMRAGPPIGLPIEREIGDITGTWNNLTAIFVAVEALSPYFEARSKTSIKPVSSKMVLLGLSITSCG